MNGLCATCRHWSLIVEVGERIADDKPAVWDEAKGKWYFPYEQYLYTLPPEHEGWRPCRLMGNDGFVREEGKRVAVVSYETVRIETAPDFGCVHWSPQEAP